MRGVRRSRSADETSPVSDEEASILFSPWRDATGVLIAASGGPDSTALLGLAAQWRAAGAETPVLAATFDHGLRPASAREARDVKAFARALGVEHRTMKWTGEKPSTRLQERAREARRQALRDLAQARGCSHVALAHHLDDQAETVLMRLIAGSGVAGLAAMREATVVDGEPGLLVLRPFLGLRKARLVATCIARGWRFIEDPSNADERFLRARLRRIAPVLAQEGLDAERLAKLGERARRADAALEGQASDWLRRHPPTCDALGVTADARLFGQPEEIIIRVLGRLADLVVAKLATAPPERLDRLEALAVALRDSAENGPPLARTFRGLLVAVHDGGKEFSLRPESPRRRGTRSS